MNNERLSRSILVCCWKYAWPWCVLFMAYVWAWVCLVSLSVVLRRLAACTSSCNVPVRKRWIRFLPGWRREAAEFGPHPWMCTCACRIAPAMSGSSLSPLRQGCCGATPSLLGGCDLCLWLVRRWCAGARCDMHGFVGSSRHAFVGQVVYVGVDLYLDLVPSVSIYKRHANQSLPVALTHLRWVWSLGVDCSGKLHCRTHSHHHHPTPTSSPGPVSAPPPIKFYKQAWWYGSLFSLFMLLRRSKSLNLVNLRTKTSLLDATLVLYQSNSAL